MLHGSWLKLALAITAFTLSLALAAMLLPPDHEPGPASAIDVLNP